jgi:hypothetical protein
LRLEFLLSTVYTVQQYYYTRLFYKNWTWVWIESWIVEYIKKDKSVSEVIIAI